MIEDSSTSFSPSKLDVYRECPRRYKFRYIDKIKSEERSVEAFMGSMAHSGLEALYEGLQHGKTLSLDEVLAVFDAAWDKELPGSPVIIRDKRYTLEDWRNAGKDCLRWYYKEHHPFDQDRTMGVETRVGFDLKVDDPETGASVVYKIGGFVDRIAVKDGVFEVHDYKTGRTLPTQAYLDSEDWQLPIYQIALQQSWPDAKTVRLKWHYLRPGKTLESSRTPEALAAVKSEVQETILAIKRDREFLPVKNPLCDWCDYKDICPLWKHVEAYEALPAEERPHENGAKLVDEYAALERRRKALREETRAIESDEEDLERRLLEYAEKHDVLQVAGAEATVEVGSKEEFRFPTRTGSPEKVELIESKLKATPVWPQVSRLDSKLLMDGFKRRKWPREVMELVESWVDKLIKHETVRTVRLHFKKTVPDE